MAPGISLTNILNRRRREEFARRSFFIISFLPLAVLLIILVALFNRSLPILVTKPLWELLAGKIWSPARGEFGFFPFIAGTFWVTVVAMLIVVLPSLLCAIYLVEYAHSATRSIMKPLLDILAAIPSVIYGIWGMITIVPIVEDYIAPFIDRWFGYIPLFKANNPTGFGILAGGIVLAVMVTPLIVAVAYEVLESVSHGLREASLALGSTRWQTVKYVVLPRALPGIIAAIVLGFSRALGETMAVLMVVGNVPKVPSSIFDPAYPLTALIANNYGEMLSIPLYDAALLGAAFVLLLMVLFFNLLSALVLSRIIGSSKQ
jgi:phosphate transport system permease protein